MFSWKIDKLESKSDDGLVVRIHWRMLASDGAIHVSDFGVIDVEQGTSFIQYQDLTEDVVLGWVFEKIGTKKTQEIQQIAVDKINNQKSSEVQSGLPWINK